MGDDVITVGNGLKSQLFGGEGSDQIIGGAARDVFAFRGRRGDLIKVLWFDGQGLCLFSKRMDRGRFVWPVPATGTVALTSAQVSMLLEGIDWRRSN